MTVTASTACWKNVHRILNVMKSINIEQEPSTEYDGERRTRKLWECFDSRHMWESDKNSRSTLFFTTRRKNFFLLILIYLVFPVHLLLAWKNIKNGKKSACTIGKVYQRNIYSLINGFLFFHRVCFSLKRNERTAKFFFAQFLDPAEHFLVCLFSSFRTKKLLSLLLVGYKKLEKPQNTCFRLVSIFKLNVRHGSVWAKMSKFVFSCGCLWSPLFNFSNKISDFMDLISEKSVPSPCQVC